MARVLVLVPDLLFGSKVQSMLEQAGHEVEMVGSEGDGLSRLVREACDSLASIPIGAQVESLNAGVAAGIALYEINRRR